MILILTQCFPSRVGGIESLVSNLAHQLKKKNKVIVFADRHNLFYDSIYDNLHKNEILIRRTGGIKFFRRRKKIKEIMPFIESEKVKFIIADTWKSLELGIEYFNKNQVPTFCLAHGNELLFNNINKMKRIKHTLEKTTHIIANSKFTKSLAIDLGVDEQKIVVINPGVDTANEIPKNDLKKAEEILKGKKNRLITVSRFDKRKNHEKVIMAIRNLKEIYPDIIYTCIGYGDEEENLKKLVIELKLENHVIFLKDIPNDLKNALIAKSNIFIMPSIIDKNSVEGFGIAFVEAAQYGIPSIGGKDGGAADAIIHEKTGLICDGNNLDDIYSSIDNLFKENKYLIYGKEAKLNSQKFHWDNIIESYKRIL